VAKEPFWHLFIMPILSQLSDVLLSLLSRNPLCSTKHKSGFAKLDLSFNTWYSFFKLMRGGIRVANQELAHNVPSR